MKEPTYDELMMLAVRHYPNLKASGFCSHHLPSDRVFACETCYVNYSSLCGEHNDLKQRAWENLIVARKALELIASETGTPCGSIAAKALAEMTPNY